MLTFVGIIIERLILLILQIAGVVMIASFGLLTIIFLILDRKKEEDDD